VCVWFVRCACVDVCVCVRLLCVTCVCVWFVRCACMDVCVCVYLVRDSHATGIVQGYVSVSECVCVLKCVYVYVCEHIC
jgi:hypothetical protein